MLDSLGPCLASNINDTDLSSLSSSDVISKIQYFIGSQFQPSQVTSDIFTQKLDTYIQNLTTQSSKETLIFDTLQDTAIFLSSFNTLVSNVRIYFILTSHRFFKNLFFFKTTMQTKGQALISQAISSKDTTSSSIQEQRLGVGNDSYIKAKLDSLKTTFRDSLLGSSSSSSVSGKRRKRGVSSSSPLTCDNLYSLSVNF
jgi:hypothetical protein